MFTSINTAFRTIEETNARLKSVYEAQLELQTEQYRQSEDFKKWCDTMREKVAVLEKHMQDIKNLPQIQRAIPKKRKKYPLSFKVIKPHMRTGFVQNDIDRIDSFGEKFTTDVRSRIAQALFMLSIQLYSEGDEALTDEAIRAEDDYQMGNPRDVTVTINMDETAQEHLRERLKKLKEGRMCAKIMRQYVLRAIEVLGG